MLHVALVDDWELRGDGSGDPWKLQFEPLGKLLSLYEEYGFKASIAAEVAQQLYHLKFGGLHHDLEVIAKEWVKAIHDAKKRGHDIQLHVHSQWHGAEYKNGFWHLPSPWAITKLEPNDALQLLTESRDYLQSVVREVEPGYRCTAFRSGAWALAPSDHLLSILNELGIIFDISIAGGLKYDNAVISLDYTDIDEDTLPYFPDMLDARKLGYPSSGIVCVPTMSFKPSLLTVLHRNATAIPFLYNYCKKTVARKINSYKEKEYRSDNYSVWRESMPQRLLRRVLPKSIVADLGQRSFVEMRDGFNQIRKRVAGVDLPIPVVLENHTKDLGNFDDIRRLCDWLSQQSDIKIVTLSDIACGIKSKRYPIRSKK